ncbi:hypothetical protein CANCADRAFT_27907 [Tortispora caseinolytica NRRL Y-17796]|uniref:Protein transport protein BOS1 n=1 Tax=Tortispora caseinolytica NRRL Y-17796 TaxID=767744 RepID=A0A1E4TCZ5_9ASCO|nr:hypothetical protein CANCADRAFT_27907 [Tortispora caseinolytica NRRL Y-17796]
MNSAFNHALRLSNTLKADLDKFAESPSTANLAIQGQISASLATFTRTIDEYNTFVSRETDTQKKAKASERVAQFRTELKEFTSKYQDLRQQRARELASGSGTASSRTDLLQQSENPFANTDTYIDPRWASRQTGTLNEHDALAGINNALDSFLETGAKVLGDLNEQSTFLRGTQARLLQAAGTLGLSGDVINRVRRRAKQDKFIFYGGAFTLLVLFVLIIKWLR